MALVPKINFCLKNTCSVISISDVTGIYHVSNNPTGWGSPNAQGADVLTATITITNPDGIEQIVDVSSQIPDPVTGDFTFEDITLSDYKDGVTSLNYTIITSTDTYRAYAETLLICNTRACVEKMWATVACKSCAGNCDLSSLIDDANLAEGLLNGLNSSASCCNKDCVNRVLEAIEQLCAFENCNC